jgi:hypothetical protein
MMAEINGELQMEWSDAYTRSRIPLPRRKPGGGQANYEVAFGRFACDLRLCSIVP